MADEDIPPPLEDMTDSLTQARRFRELVICSDKCKLPTKVSSVSDIPPSSHHLSIPSLEKEDSCTSNQELSMASLHNQRNSNDNAVDSAACHSKSQQHIGEFGGMKMGFLSSSTKCGVASNTKSCQLGRHNDDNVKENDPIPIIEPNKKHFHERLRIDEVQEAMKKSNGVLKNNDWVTEELLSKIQNNSYLSERLLQPKFMEVVAEFQSDPTSASKKYQHNSEIQLFLKEFCVLMGGHFTMLAEKHDLQSDGMAKRAGTSQTRIRSIADISDKADLRTAPANVNDSTDRTVDQIISDPVHRQILNDSNVQQLIYYMKNNPERAQSILVEADNDLRQKVQQLISLGLLQFKLP